MSRNKVCAWMERLVRSEKAFAGGLSLGYGAESNQGLQLESAISLATPHPLVGSHAPTATRFSDLSV
jgi:hypothetical protein